MKHVQLAAILAAGAALSGCATIIQGTTESVSVASYPEQGALCTLSNSEGTWYLTTPGNATVHKTRSDLAVDCTKPGYAAGHAVAASRFGGTTAGNLIAGGVIGLGVDAISGADFYYDSPVTVLLGAPATATLAPAPAPAPTNKAGS